MKINIKEEVKGLQKVYNLTKKIEENKKAIVAKLESRDSCYREAGLCNSDEAIIAMRLQERGSNAFAEANLLREKNNELIKTLLSIADQVVVASKLKKQDIRRALDSAEEGSKLEADLLDLDERLNIAVYVCNSAKETYATSGENKKSNNSEYGDGE